MVMGSILLFTLGQQSLNSGPCVTGPKVVESLDHPPYLKAVAEAEAIEELRRTSWVTKSNYHCSFTTAVWQI